MKKNMGSVDQIIRLAIALGLLALNYEKVLPSPLDLAAYIVVGILALTSIVRFCPLYTIFGIYTCKKE